MCIECQESASASKPAAEIQSAPITAEEGQEKGEETPARPKSVEEMAAAFAASMKKHSSAGVLHKLKLPREQCK
jgi:hypothetical protein